MQATTDKNEKMDPKIQMPPTPEFLGDMWDSTLKMQRQWFNTMTQPFGFMPAPEKMWDRWQMFGTECLDETERSFVRMKDFMSAEVGYVRQLNDKTLEMTKKVGEKKDESVVMTPELTRELMDTSRRCLDKTVEFGKDNFKAASDFGMKMTEMMMKEPIKKG